MTAKETTAAHATWTQPGTPFTVSYSLPLFHEIDFIVNEGYRRIPHGGIEVGGILFGRVDGNSVTVDAFRSIECEHASGPSFILSDHDIALLRQQLATAASDPELEGLQLAGWFISHSRSDLRMSEREATVFDDLFPEPGKITLLIKPERFQPTRFGFLIREPDGRVNPDAIQHAMILPLPGRADRGAGSDAIPSIPAASGERSTTDAALLRQGERSRENLSPVPLQDLRGTAPESLVESGPQRSEAVEGKPPVGEVFGGQQGMRAMSNRLSKAISREASLPDTRAERSPASADARVETPTEALVRTRTLPPLEEIRRMRPLELQRTALDPGDLTYQIRPSKGADTRFNLRLASALLLAALLGCALGYWTYQRLSPSAIPLTVEPKPSTLLVSWPVDETQDSGFAVLKINDGNPMPLTPEQRAAGEAEISVAGDNLKVELIVQHRIGDARGIVRYVRAPKAPGPQNP
ncbi:MAG: hypothetical protein ACR2JB_19210 [Bryobacteraceae bacterium]